MLNKLKESKEIITADVDVLLLFRSLLAQLRQLQSLIKQTVSKGAQTSTCLLVGTQSLLDQYL